MKWSKGHRSPSEHRARYVQGRTQPQGRPHVHHTHTHSNERVSMHRHIHTCTDTRTHSASSPDHVHPDACRHTPGPRDHSRLCTQLPRAHTGCMHIPGPTLPLLPGLSSLQVQGGPRPQVFSIMFSGGESDHLTYLWLQKEVGRRGQAGQGWAESHDLRPLPVGEGLGAQTTPTPNPCSGSPAGRPPRCPPRP